MLRMVLWLRVVLLMLRVVLLMLRRVLLMLRMVLLMLRMVQMRLLLLGGLAAAGRRLIAVRLGATVVRRIVFLQVHEHGGQVYFAVAVVGATVVELPLKTHQSQNV